MRMHMLSASSFDQHLGFSQGLKHFPVEQFNSGQSVKTHHVSIFLRTASLHGEFPDTNRLNIKPKGEILVRFDFGLVVFWWN